MSKTTISISVDDGIVAEMRRIAEENNRSMSNQIETSLTDWLINRSEEKINAQKGGT